MSVNERIKKIQEHYFPNNQKGFAEKIGLSNSTFTDIVKNGNEPSFKTTLKIIQNYPELNVNWLFKGDGQMFSEGNEKDIGYGKRFFPIQNIAGEEASEYNAINNDIDKDKIIADLQAQLDEKKDDIKYFKNLVSQMLSEKTIEAKAISALKANNKIPIEKVLDEVQNEVMKGVKSQSEKELVANVFTKILTRLLMGEIVL